MKKFLFTPVFLLVTLLGYGQCPTEGLNLNTQADIDAFSSNYPNCTELTNFLSIAGMDITNFNGLSQITSINYLEIGETSAANFVGFNNVEVIEDGMQIFGNSYQNFEGFDSLTSGGDISVVSEGIINFEGLENLVEMGRLDVFSSSAFQNFIGLSSLTSCEGIFVEDCDSFIDFTGLEGLQNSTASIRIDNNISFSSFKGLENLKSVDPGHFFVRNCPVLSGFTNLESLEKVRNYIWVLNCDSVENLDGFENIQQLDFSFRLIGNQNLSSISGFSNLRGNYQFGIRILDNPNLSTCNIATVCENLFVDDIAYFEIENNGSGCNSISEVADACGAVPIPDTNLLNSLLNHNPVIDINTDNLIQYSEAGQFSGNLNLANKQISDFEGLQTFVNASGINVSQNTMGFLNLNQNLELEEIDFSSSANLRSVALKNNNNTAITSFNGLNCPTLEFVCVDDVAFAEANFTNIDPQVQFVEDCEVLAVADFNIEDSIALFPNPVSEILTIAIAENFNFTSAAVYSVSGQKLMETSVKQLDMGDLSTGIYFVEVVTELGSITKKIVKQ